MCGDLINYDKYFFLFVFMEPFLVSLDNRTGIILFTFSSSGFAFVGQLFICCSLLPWISNSSVSLLLAFICGALLQSDSLPFPVTKAVTSID